MLVVHLLHYHGTTTLVSQYYQYDVSTVYFHQRIFFIFASRVWKQQLQQKPTIFRTQVTSKNLVLAKINNTPERLIREAMKQLSVQRILTYKLSKYQPIQHKYQPIKTSERPSKPAIWNRHEHQPYDLRSSCSK